MNSTTHLEADQFTVAEQHMLLLKSAGGQIVHGGIDLKSPHIPYMECLVHALAPFLLRVTNNWPNRALSIGLGAGEIPRFMLKHFPACELHVAEISEQVIQLARTTFQCPPNSPVFSVHKTCGAEFIKQTKAPYDYILVDGFSAEGAPGPLESADFYNDCRNALSDDGFLVLNLFPKAQDPDAQAKLLTACFGYPPHILQCKSISNRIAILHKSEANPRFSPKDLLAANKKLSDRTGVNFNLTTNLLFQALMTAPRPAW